MAFHIDDDDDIDFAISPGSRQARAAVSQARSTADPADDDDDRSPTKTRSQEISDIIDDQRTGRITTSRARIRFAALGFSVAQADRLMGVVPSGTQAIGSGNEPSLVSGEQVALAQQGPKTRESILAAFQARDFNLQSAKTLASDLANLTGEPIDQILRDLATQSFYISKASGDPSVTLSSLGANVSGSALGALTTNLSGDPSGSSGPVPLGQGDIDAFSQQRGFDEVARGLTLETGVAPGFRDFIESAIGRQGLAFNLDVLRGGGNESDLESPSRFEEFIRNKLSGTGILGNNRGDTFRGIADFLRTPSSDFGELTRQGILRKDLLSKKEGAVGAELFAPLINAITAPSGSRFAAFGSGGRAATGSAIRNLFAKDERRFTTAPGFLDFLGQQGIF